MIPRTNAALPGGLPWRGALPRRKLRVLLISAALTLSCHFVCEQIRLAFIYSQPALTRCTSVPPKRKLCSSKATRRSASSDDVGYNLLFETAPEEFDGLRVTASKPFPAYARGAFVIPSIGQFEMGARRFVGFLDCFGKLQKFDIHEDQVTATYKLMDTGFFNESRETGTIGAGLLFFETEPPRETPWYLGPVANMPPFAPNDNTYVNTISVGNKLLSLTDSYTMTAIDKKTLRVTGTQKWDDDLQDLVCYTGSAHPLRHPVTGDWINFIGNAGLLSEETTIRLYSLSEKAPSTRRSIADVVMDTAPYMHSFGVTDNYVILPRMPVKFSAQEVAMKPMAAAFQATNPLDEGPGNAFHVIPLDGSPASVRTLPVDQPLWYVHTVNAFENSTGIVIDLTTTPQNPFSSDLTIEASRSKVIRDRGAAGGKNLVKRFHIPFDPGAPVSSVVVSDPHASTDFPCVNPKFRSRSHRYFWAVEWFSGSDSYASMSIVKYDLSSGAKIAWRRPDWYPSEATMVASDRDGAAEDEGILLFVALDGSSGETFLIGVDAQTMETVSEAGPFPRIAFSTHGSFYPSV